MSISMKAARVNAEMTLEAAAKELGITKNTLINYESGKIAPRVDMAQKIADLYGMPFDGINFLPLDVALSIMTKA